MKDAAPLAISLCQAGFRTCSYHCQKMSAHDKLQSMESWRSGDVKIMVCTTAFGMGIDQPDVELVMRVGCPPTLESMIQEFGRGGRDGRPAKGKEMYTKGYANVPSPSHRGIDNTPFTLNITSFVQADSSNFWLTKSCVYNYRYFVLP